jgi:hypothetical protein
MLEEVLDLADKGETTLEQERYDELEKRLTKLDAKNSALHMAKTRSRNFAKSALKMLEEYQAGAVPMTLTEYEFARLLANALESDALAHSAEALRVKARDAGLLHGAVYKIGGRAGAWTSLFERPDEEFESGETTLAISNVRPVGRIFMGAPLTGEYELRCTLNRVGDLSLTTFQGVVFAGSPTAQWFVAGIGGKGQLVLRRYDKSSSERALKIFQLDPLVAKDESPTFVVHVFKGNRVVIRVGDRAPVEVTLEEPLPKTAYIGVFAKNGRTELHSTVLEIFP